MIKKLDKTEQVTFFAPLIPLGIKAPISANANFKGREKAIKIFDNGRYLLGTLTVSDDMNRPLRESETFIATDIRDVIYVEAKNQTKPGEIHKIKWCSTGRVNLKDLPE